MNKNLRITVNYQVTYKWNLLCSFEYFLSILGTMYEALFLLLSAHMSSSFNGRLYPVIIRLTRKKIYRINTEWHILSLKHKGSPTELFQ